jgi:hypothetical protein
VIRPTKPVAQLSSQKNQLIAVDKDGARHSPQYGRQLA